MSELAIHPRTRLPPPAVRLKRITSRRRCLRTAGYAVCAALLQLSPTTASETSAGSACTHERATALSEIACELAAQLQLAQPTLVVSAPPEADAKLADGSRLAGRIAMLVAARLGPKATAHQAAAKLATAQGLAAKRGALLFLEPRIRQGKLGITANLYPIAQSFWDRVKNPTPTAVSHGYAERRLDPELRSFFAPIPLVARINTLATPPERAPVALACGDVDQDGSPEVAFVGRRRVAMGRFEKGRFVASAAKDWAELSPVAATPLRAPIASAEIKQGAVDVGSSDRARFLRLDAQLLPVQTGPRRIPFGWGCLDLDGHQLSSEPIRCLPRDAPPASAKPAPSAARAASLALLDRHGKPTQYVASYLPQDDAIVVAQGGRALARVDGAGAQLALTDLDGDARPELLSSTSALDPAEDALLVHTLQADGRLVQRLRLDVPDGITAIAACPTPTAEMAPIVVGTLARIWIVQ